MATLVSPGVSVTVTDESFYIPAEASTVPLIFVATAEQKMQPNGTAIAIGTTESNVVRTVTSLTQSTQLYGIPRFLESGIGDAHHGDARNEYGVLALNQFLGVGNRAYVVRANVNLNTDGVDDLFIDRAEPLVENLVTAIDEYIDEFNLVNGYVTGDVNFKTSVTGAEVLSLIEQELAPLFTTYNFSSQTLQDALFDDHTAGPLDVYNASFTSKTATFLGIEGQILDEAASNSDEFDSLTVDTMLTDVLSNFTHTMEFVNSSSLGADDTARRASIVTALQATVNQPQMRAEGFEYNLILCPGYHELNDELVALSTDISNEAIVIGDLPMNMDAEEVVTWAESSDRVMGNNIAYYYSHGLSSNLDGKDVLGSSAGVALRTITVSDNMSQVWFAPAGAQRGMVTGVSKMGHCSGTLGGPTEFIEVLLNQGHRDNMYKVGTNLNPITFLPGRGIIVMGQKTSSPTSSALDRVNVIRLLAYIRRALRKSTFAFVFEPNDQITRDNLKAMVDGFLNDIVVKRGLYDFATQCDESNNTPDRIDRSELWIDVALKPVKAAEFIYIPIRVVSTGADI